MEDLVFTFFDKKKNGRELSNFWVNKVIIDNRVYNSGEAAFHGSKYIEISKHSKDDRRAQLLFLYGKKFEVDGEFGSYNGYQLKRAGGKRGLSLTEKEIGIWTEVGVDVQRQICTYKYNNYEQVRSVLASTGTKVLVHPAQRCSEKNVVKKWWEGKATLDSNNNLVILGNNILGKLWMEVRDNVVYV